MHSYFKFAAFSEAGQIHLTQCLPCTWQPIITQYPFEEEVKTPFKLYMFKLVILVQSVRVALHYSKLLLLLLILLMNLIRGLLSETAQHSALPSLLKPAL